MSGAEISWLAGDGSDRCYYRVQGGGRPDPAVLMQLSGVDAEKLKADSYDWITLGRLISREGVLVPQVLATMKDHAALLIEDYGDLMLEGRVYELAEKGDFDAVSGLYRRCAEVVKCFLSIRPDPAAVWCQRSFDTERYVWELNFFAQKYLQAVAGIRFTPTEQDSFERETHALAGVLAKLSTAFVHRDFHSRNVMIVRDQVAIIDFQDARLGAAAYDLVSLYFDSYVPFTGAFRAELLAEGMELLDSAEVAATWKSVLLQRQIKAIGSFGFLTVDKKRGDYLKYVDPALRTLEEAAVYDARWPFLSGELLARMRAQLAK